MQNFSHTNAYAIDTAVIFEPVAGYLEDENPFEDRYHSDPIEDLYIPIPQTKLAADDHDMNLFQVVWVQGKTASMLAFALDDHSAIVPAFGIVPIKPQSFRFAKHKTARLAHVQSALAEAYKEHYKIDDCDWSVNAEHIPSGYDLELGSRYETDTDPNSEDNYEPDHHIDYIALAAADIYTGGTVAPRQYGHLVPREQMAHAQPVYTQSRRQSFAVRTVADQQKNKFRRTPARELLAQTA